MEHGGKGHTDGFAPVKVDLAMAGDLLDCRITGLDGDCLVGVPA